MAATGKESLLTRRSWAALIAAVPLASQVTSTPARPTAPVQLSAGDDIRKTSELLSQTEVPMSVEPAFTFHV